MNTLYVSQFLSTNGDGTGTSNANGTYGSPGTDFYIEPVGEYPLKLARMIWFLRDTSGMQAEEYGNFASELTNGVQLLVEDASGNTIVNITPDPIKTNAEWAKYCYDTDLKTWGNGDEVMVSRWTFAKAGIGLNLAPGEKLIARLTDDFSGAISQQFLVQGYYDKS